MNMQNKGQADGNAIPAFLPAMIQDFPGNADIQLRNL
jgi:hypothetical protein